MNNVLKALVGVKNWGRLTIRLGVHVLGSLKDIVEQFLQGQGHYQPSWRAAIFVLDEAGETHVANRIWSYGEPVQGVCVCVCVVVVVVA